ncbi:MAG: paraquat-inducible protein A [Gammaproteobacteria bacterium]|nr:paraquat-inducible protein A [Gammaproteobacteria bacterium]
MGTDHSTHHLVACHECDTVQRLPDDPARGRVRCARCGHVLHRCSGDLVATPLALGLAAAVLFVVSNTWPLMDFTLQGYRDSTYLLAGISQLYAQGMTILATVVLLTTFVAPLVHILLLVYVYLPLAFGRRPPGFPIAIRVTQGVVSWSMLEIFLLGVIVAAVKLAEQATIVPGPAAWSLGLLVVLLAMASTQVHPHLLWQRVK